MFSVVRSGYRSGQRDRRADFQLTVSCAAALAVAAFGLVLPEPPMSPPLAVAAMVTPAESANAVSVSAVGQTAEPAAEIDAAPAKLAVNPACAQQSWPYVCTEGSANAETQRRLRVISADRNAPTSIIVSASTRGATATTETMPPTPAEPPRVAAVVEEGPAQPVSPVALHDQAAVVAPVAVAAPIVAAMAEAASDADAAPVATPAATRTPPTAKRARSARRQSRNRAPRAAAVRMATNGRHTFAYNDEQGLSGRALGYDAYPRHRVESFPWISGR